MMKSSLFNMLNTLNLGEIRQLLKSGPPPATIEELESRIQDVKRAAAKVEESTKDINELLQELFDTKTEPAPTGTDALKKSAEDTSEKIHDLLEEMRPGQVLMHFVVTATYAGPSANGKSKITNAVLVGDVNTDDDD